MTDRRFALVRMELIGEPTITPDGQSIQHARFPWQRPGDGSHGISLTDIVMSDLPSRMESLGAEFAIKDPWLLYQGD